MSHYTDAKGVVYTYQSGYTDGDVVILSDDLAAWRVNKVALAEASSVFADMLSGVSSVSGEIKLSESTQADLDAFIRTIFRATSTQISLGIDALGRVIDLLVKYDRVGAARKLLYGNVVDVSSSKLFDAFVLASRLDDLSSGCRVLSQGHKWYTDWMQPTQPPLTPNSITRPWGPKEFARLQPHWVWSLTIACTSYEANRAQNTTGWNHPNTWIWVMGGFMSGMTK